MNRIKELRRQAEMKQEALAGLLMKKQQAVSKYETGQLDLDTDTIARLCEIFACTSDYLLGLSDRRAPEISEDDAAVLAAYHACSAETRRIVDAALQPYLEKKTSSASPAEKEA